ncbi:cell envelope integrity protein CreD [Myroides albus]|uniref:cell envelope integrity protein CreD n=1 Tax=Myroides albus TaxID=2562892 RepID=UPI002158D877|nr:cell envelope integrity protein CreD [Myroides albus]UVD79606.1 cell envelope integrity protein CreD [Myroides albus]
MEKENQKPMIKGIIITVLSLLLLIAIPFITGIVSERESFQREVKNEVTSKWGNEQTIYGPFIYVEYKKTYVQKDNTIVERTVPSLTSPQSQNIAGKVETQIKKRSLYEVTLYNTNLNVDASFISLDKIAEKLKLDSKDQFTTAKIVFAISDSRGFTEQININGNPSNFFEQDNEISTKSSLNLLSFDIKESTIDLSKISFPLHLKGSTELKFLATAKENKVKLNTTYQDIKYIGSYLPDSESEKMTLSNPTWTIFQSFPFEANINNLESLETFEFGLKFLQMNDFYSKVNRATKYALLFIGLTFATFFFMENLKNLQINILHYALVGLALCINFVLLLSFAEYVGFSYAYLISATATITLITSFLYGLSKNKRIALTIMGLLSLLYTFLFFLLQLKEAALIVGSIGLFAILAILMYFSKRITFSK